MNIITLDFETFYDRDWSLTKVTTEEYIRSHRFEAIMCGVKINGEKPYWITGTHAEMKPQLQSLDWANSALLAHNTMFDGAILSFVFDCHPKVLLDTLCMARALHGVEAGGSLKALAERYEIGVKGTEVVNALGKHRADFSKEELERYAEYCVNDVVLTYDLFQILVAKFPPKELKVIDLTLKMFTEPVLELDALMLEQHMRNVCDKKAKLLAACETEKEMLMSNEKFAGLLRQLHVDPPMKTSPTTGKLTYAFAKSDEAFKELLEHPDLRVQVLVAARLGNKSTLEESRTQRFMGIANRGLMPVPLRYYAAHTGRWGGDDKVNLQNLPSRGQNANKLKLSIKAPEGYVMIDCDSSQIEARVLAWLAGQDDLVEAFAKGEDVYKIMASSIYAKPVEEIEGFERFVGKTTILGCIAEGTLVLCMSGWKPIEQVSLQDSLWDGKEWVCHQGLVAKGTKETLEICGSWLTADHKILCGTEWKEARLVAQEQNTLCQALDIGAENLPLQAMLKGFGMGYPPLLLDVIVAQTSTLWINITSKILKVLGVIRALKNLAITPVNYIGGIVKSSQTMHIVKDSLTASQAVFLGAIQKLAKHFPTMEGEEFLYMKSGEKIGLSSYSTLYHSRIGTYLAVTSTASTTTKGMNPEIYDSQLGQKTLGINEKSKSCNRNLMTYDIALAGPRNRFTIATNAGPIIVHNCGYGMGGDKFHGQLITSGAELELQECKRIISVYRATYSKIPALWRQAQLCIEAMITGSSCTLGREGVIRFDPTMKGFELPNGLWQRYDTIRQGTNKEGYPEFSYKTRKGQVKLYGGKLIENICQALARCIIAEQMVLIAKKYRVVLTVHDAIGVVVPVAESKEAQAYIEECMRWVPKWATGLPLNCESGMGESYGDC